MAEEIIIKVIRINSEQAEQALAAVDDATEEVVDSTSKLDNQLGQLPGPLGKAQQGVQGLSKAFKAMLANPVVLAIAALVAALAGLFKAFTKTQAGADKMNEVMKGLGAAIDVLVERAAILFSALGKIFTGRFKEGFAEVGEAVSGVGSEIKEATIAAVAFERQLIALYNAETDILAVNAERRQQIAELVFITRDQTRSVEERRNAIIQADAIEKEILADNIRLQQMRLDIARQEMANTPEQLRTREQLRAVAEAEAALIQLQTDSLNKQRELKNRLNELDNKARADAKAAAAELAAEEKDRADALAEEEKMKSEQRKADREIELALEAEMNALFLDMNQDLADKTKAIDDKLTADLIANAEDRFQTEEQLAIQQIQAEQMLGAAKEAAYRNSVSAILGFLGEGTKAAKAVQIADATRSAIKGAINAYTSTLQIPFGVGAALAPFAAAAALAAGMANVKRIASTTDPLTGASGSVPSPSLNLPGNTVPVETMDSILQADLGIADDVNIIQDRTSRTASKAYVVESELSAQQEIQRQREAEITL